MLAFYGVSNTVQDVSEHFQGVRERLIGGDRWTQRPTATPTSKRKYRTELR